MNETINRDLYKKGVDIPPGMAVEMWNFILEEGKSLIDTAFVRGGDIQDEDVDALKSFYQKVYDFQEERFGEDGAVFNRSLQRHLLLDERFSEVGAKLLGLDKNELRAKALLHDFGRTFSHRRGRNDAIELALFKKLGFSEEFTGDFPEDSLWTSLSEDQVSEQVTRLKEKNGGIGAAIVLFDVLAKWKGKEGGPLRRWEDVIPQTKQRQNSPDKGKMWPSEFTRQSKITSSAGDSYIGVKYESLKDWFEEKSGIKIDDFVKKVEGTLEERPLANKWA